LRSSGAKEQKKIAGYKHLAPLGRNAKRRSVYFQSEFALGLSKGDSYE
jgi:hypothetical protein